jgi:hypothetical protein
VARLLSIGVLASVIAATLTLRSVLAALVPSLVVRTLPSTPIVERGRDRQSLNFDMIIANPGPTALHLRRIEVSTFDASGALITRKDLDENGFPSGMETLPHRELPAHGSLGIFNPFFSIDGRPSISRLRYTFFFADSSDKRLTQADLVIYPSLYRDRTTLDVPLHGRLFVLDGHDFYSHHRRQDISSPEAAQAGVSANPMRYADDFVFVDASGAMYHGSPLEKRNWYGYGQPVYAPGTGTIVAVVNDVAEAVWDGHRLHVPKDPPDASPFGLGNYVLIDHGDGEFSALLHLVPGSIRVRRGDRVGKGEIIGRLGTSDAGDPTYPVAPHLHYNLMRGSDFAKSEGLPAYFEHFTLLRGGTTIPVTDGALDTGDFFKS